MILDQRTVQTSELLNRSYMMRNNSEFKTILTFYFQMLQRLWGSYLLFILFWQHTVSCFCWFCFPVIVFTFDSREKLNQHNLQLGKQILNKTSVSDLSTGMSTGSITSGAVS